MCCRVRLKRVKTDVDERHAYVIYEKIRFPVRISASAEILPSLISAPLERVMEIPATKMGVT